MRAQLLIVTLFASVTAVQSAQRLRAGSVFTLNPIRKVVTLLQSMQAKVADEGDKEEALYKKFMCYCQNSGSSLKDGMAAAEAKIEVLTSELAGAEERSAGLKQAIQQAQNDRAAAKAALRDGAAVREKESAAFASEKGDSDANIVALNSAIAALAKGMGGFLQTAAAASLRAVLEKNILGMDEMDRQTLAAFLEGSQSSGYAPRSAEVVGILKQMGGTMGSDLAEAQAAEKAAVETYAAMVAAKKKEINSLTATIEAKMTASGEAAVAVVQMKNDLAETKEGLTADLGFSADLAKGCDTKKAEWEVVVKERSEELLALSETIKILNEDDALDLFKHTLPGASAFIQMTASAAALRSRALADVRMTQVRGHKHHRLDFIALALHNKKIGFGKVIDMIDAMIKTLDKEQLDDDHKTEYCVSQFDLAGDKVKDLGRKVSAAESSSATTSDAIATVTQELASLVAGVKALDKSVAQATEQRKAEHADFQELMSSDSAAKELLVFAQNRLNKFYSPKLYKPAPESAFAQVSVHMQDMVAPPPPPETFGAYTKKSGEHMGVTAMLDLLIKDLDKEMTLSSADEKDSQADYEDMMKNSAEKRVLDSNSITGKASTKADLEEDLEAHNAAGANAKAELLATSKFVASLHADCDWLMQNADARKAARDNEVSNLGNAKAVLSGADYSF